MREGRIPHLRGALREFLAGCEPGSPVAVETVGNWYWIVDEIEKAGFKPKLVHAGKVKLMLGLVKVTDKLDARGLNKLQRAGTLPTVWIPPGDLRGKRELTRARMVLVRERHSLRTGSTLRLPSTDWRWRQATCLGEGAPQGAVTTASPSHPPGREPVPQVGVQRGGGRCNPPPAEAPRKAREPAL